MLLLEGAETPNARSDKDAGAIGVEGGAFESCISPGFGGSAHGEVGVAIGAANVLGIFERFHGIEVTNFACETAVVAGSVEGGDRTDATGALEEACPGGGKIVGEGCEGTQPGDDDAAGAHNKGAQRPAEGDLRSWRRAAGVIWTACPRCTLRHRPR